jgi:hypothetical protein
MLTKRNQRIWQNMIISTSSNNVGHLITSTIIRLQHFAILHRTSPNYTSQRLSTLHFLSFTLHRSPIWLNLSTFPIVLFHLTSLNYTQYSSYIPKMTSKIMNPFIYQPPQNSRHFPSLHYSFYFIFSHILSTLHFTLLCCSHLQLSSLQFLLIIAFTSPTVLHFPNPRFENMSFTVGRPYRPFR